MNDHDIERLISRLDRPSPTSALDARIAEIARQAQPARRGWPIRRALGFGTAIACAGLLGFVIGRQSVSVPPAQPAFVEKGIERRPAAELEAAVPEATVPEAAAPEVVVRAFVPANEAFAQLMTKSKRFESVFGDQPFARQAGPAAIP